MFQSDTAEGALLFQLLPDIGTSYFGKHRGAQAALFPCSYFSRLKWICVQLKLRNPIGDVILKQTYCICISIGQERQAERI